MIQFGQVSDTPLYKIQGKIENRLKFSKKKASRNSKMIFNKQKKISK